MFFTYSKNLVVFYFILLSLFLVINNSSFALLSNVIIFLFLIPVWFIYKHLESSRKNEAHFKQSINDLVEKNRELTNEIKIIEEIYDDINIVSFSYTCQIINYTYRKGSKT